MKRRTFFEGLTPLANKLREMRASTPPPVSKAKDVPALLEKKAAKLARRAKQAGY